MDDRVADERREDGADVFAHHEIGDLVEIGRFAIDDDQFRAVLFGYQTESGRGPDHERCAYRDEKVARQRELARTPHCRIGHRLAERDGRGLDIAAACGTIGRAAIPRLHVPAHPRQLIALVAIQAQAHRSYCREAR